MTDEHDPNAQLCTCHGCQVLTLTGFVRAHAEELKKFKNVLHESATDPAKASPVGTKRDALKLAACIKLALIFADGVGQAEGMLAQGVTLVPVIQVTPEQLAELIARNDPRRN